MKKIYRSLLLLPAFIFLTINLQAADLFWVGNGGDWNDASHWAATSGGPGGAGVPNENTSVTFDSKSFATTLQQVNISGKASCKDFIWNNVTNIPTLAGPKGSSIEIYGSMGLTRQMICDFEGDWVFKSTATGNKIMPHGHILKGNVQFAGVGGEWTLDGYLMTDAKSSITLKSGVLKTNNQLVTTGLFQVIGNEGKTLEMGASTIVVHRGFNSASTKKFRLSNNGGRLVTMNNAAFQNVSQGSKKISKVENQATKN